MARWAALLLLATAAVLGLALAHPGHDHGNNDDQDSDALRMFHHSGDASAVNFPSYSLGMGTKEQRRKVVESGLFAVIERERIVVLIERLIFSLILIFALPFMTIR